jgi:hypothetical protein
MKLWVDDIRPAPYGYIWCKSVKAAKDAIEARELLAGITWHYEDGTVEKLFPFELIDMDHDAGDYGPPDYIAILGWLEETGRNYPIRIHSMNPVGVENMRRIIQKNGWTEVR